MAHGFSLNRPSGIGAVGGGMANLELKWKPGVCFLGVAGLVNMWRVSVLIISLLISPEAAFAERWQSVTSGEDGSKWRVDRDSVRIDLPYVHFLAIEEPSSPILSKAHNAYVSSLQKSYAADCSRKTFAITAYIARDSSGETIDTYSSPQQRWKQNEIIPDSVAFALVEFACESAGQWLGERNVEAIKFLTSDLWELVETRSESQTYLDRGSNSRTDQGMMALSMAVYKEPQPIGGMFYTRVVTYTNFDCVELNASNVFLWYYNSSGRIVTQEQHESKPERPQAGSSGAALLNAICSRWLAVQGAKSEPSDKTENKELGRMPE